MDKINQGNELLIKKENWVDRSEIQGDDEKVMMAPILRKAQERIIDLFEPKNNIAFVSLCSSTRPYSKSRKWSHFINEFDGVDFTIMSGPGIIPIEYDSEYPYMTYDQIPGHNFDNISKLFYANVLVRFFILKKYDYIVFNFKPHMKHRVWASNQAGNYLKQRGHIKDFVITPNERTYSLASMDGFAELGLCMFPDLHPIVLRDMHKKIDIFKER